MFEKLKEIIPMYFGQFGSIINSLPGFQSEVGKIIIVGIFSIIALLFFMKKK